jgi:hypothetical protein
MVSFTCNVNRTCLRTVLENMLDPSINKHPFVEIPGKLPNNPIIHKLIKQQNKLPNNSHPIKPNPFYTPSSGVLLHWISIS